MPRISSPSSTTRRKRKTKSPSESRDEPKNKKQKQDEFSTTAHFRSGIIFYHQPIFFMIYVFLMVFCLICIEPTPQSAKKWTLESLVRDIVKEEYIKQNMEDFIEEDLNLLRNNRVIKLKQLASLTEEDKKLLPVMLRDILDDASLPQGMSFDL